MTEQPISETAPSSSASSEMPAAPSATETRDARYFEEPDHDAGLPLTGTEEAPVGAETRYSRRVGEGDAERYFAARTGDDPEATAKEAAAYCEHHCPIQHACAGEECAVYRAEANALSRVEANAEGRTAVAGVVLPAAWSNE